MNTSRLLSQFRVSVAMKPYVLRVRLRGSDFDFGSDPETAATFTKCINEMRRILVKKRHVSAITADRAILKTCNSSSGANSTKSWSGSLEPLSTRNDAKGRHAAGLGAMSRLAR